MQQPDKQREAFEAWYGENYSQYALKTRREWKYDNLDTELAWQAWQAAQQTQWLPIETAPRDETVVLTYAKTSMGISFISSMFFIDDDWYLFDTGELPDVQPSYWMPLPPEPNVVD